MTSTAPDPGAAAAGTVPSLIGADSPSGVPVPLETPVMLSSLLASAGEMIWKIFNAFDAADLRGRSRSQIALTLRDHPH